MDGRNVERVAAAAQIPAVRERHRHTRHNPELQPRARVPQPPVSAEDAGRIGDLAGIEKRAQLDFEKRVGVNGPVRISIEEEVSAAEWSAALLTVVGADVCAKRQVVIALETQDEQLVERDRAEYSAGPYARAQFVPVALRLREPAR